MHQLTISDPDANPFYQPVHIHVMNPKSITMEELYGGVDKLTLEWKDGLMAITVRQAVNVSEHVTLGRLFPVREQL